MSNEKGFGNIETIMEKQVNRTNHLLGIAINDYEHCPKLNNAVKDVEDFIDLMKNQFAFESENIYTLFDDEATGSNIIEQLDELAEKLTENDNLIIYFSGHGALHPRQGNGYWIPVKARQDKYFDYLANAVIKEHLSAIAAHHIFLIADSCFSGALFTQGAKDVGKRLEKNPSRWGLTSGQKEIVLDGKPGENSPFAKSLLLHLGNTTRPIGVQELCSNVLETTAANAQQTPLGEPLQVKGHQNGQFVFRLKKDEIRDWAKAKSIETIASLQQFLAVYPDGQFAEAAKIKINTTKAENAWRKIENSNKVLDFARYKKQFPNSKYAAEAQQRLLIAEEDEIWNKAKRANMISRYERYLDIYPNGRYVIEAKAVINTMLNSGQEPQGKPRREGKKQEAKPKPPKPKFDWKKLPLKQIGIALAILILIITVVQLGLFSPEAKLSFEEKNNLIGLKSGDEWLIEPKYYTAKDFQEKLAAVNLNNKWGYINEKGTTVIEHQYTTANSFVDGLAAVCDGDSCGFIDINGQIIIPFIYESVANFEFNEEKVWVQKDGQAFYINKIGECVQDCEENEPEKEAIVKPIPISDPFAAQMLPIPSGTFEMGSNENSKEKPIHSVTVSSFYMSKYEVTQKQWREVMGTTIQQQRDKANEDWSLYGVGDNYPMYYVSWNEIKEFIKKLNAKTGKNYRLPTEIEWEYAAKGGGNYKYAGGNNIRDVAWHNENSDNKTHPVGKKAVNGYGLHDMTGNVWEWCEDTWHDNYEGAPTNGSAWTSGGNSAFRVLRGGSWRHYSEGCRIVSRGYYARRNDAGGFRLVLP